MKPVLAVVLIVTSLGLVGVSSASASALEHTAATKYSNCAKLNQHFPHGVGRKGAHDHVATGAKPVTNFTVSTASYNANSSRDRDKDGVACEKH